MNVSTRYGRWLSTLNALLRLYLLFVFAEGGNYWLAVLFGIWALLDLYKLYKRGSSAGSWRLTTADLGGGILSLLIITLLIWVYFVIISVIF